MVAQQDILAANALINDNNAPKVSVFVGGTSGIGKLTIRALVSTGASVRIYLIGRKSSVHSAGEFMKELNAINSKAEIIWAEGEISLLKDCKDICERIKKDEGKIDLLFMTAGYAPFNGRNLTEEGLEVTQVLEYYSRMLFIMLLMPELQAAEMGRVVSVLGGGLERTSINIDDINLEKPGAFGGAKAQTQWVALNSIFMDKLAVEHLDITFIHSWPGWVNTGNVKRSADPNSLAGWLLWLLAQPLILLFSMTDDTSAQRNLFQATSSMYGGKGTPWKDGSGLNTKEERGNGLFLVNWKAECTPNAKNMAVLREKAQEKVWTKTMEVLKPYV